MIPRSPILRLGALFEYLYGKFLLDFYECRVDNFSKSWLNSYLKMYVKRKEVGSNLIQKVFLFKRRRQIDRLPIFVQNFTIGKNFMFLLAQLSFSSL